MLSSEDMMVTPDKLRTALEQANVDVLIATSLKNVFYTTGLWTTPTINPGADNHVKTGMYTDFAPSKTLGLVTADAEPKLITPPVVATHVPELDLDLSTEDIYVYGRRAMDPTDATGLSERDQRTFDIFRRAYENRTEALTDALSDLVNPGCRIAVEGCGVYAEECSFVREAIVDLPHDEIIPGDAILQQMRLTKTDEELRRIRRAAEINEAAIESALEAAVPGMTERQLATVYKQQVYEFGGEEQLPAAHTFVGIGPHSAYPHALPGERELREGDLIRFEVGCRHLGYASDLARTAAFRSVDNNIGNRYDVLHDAMSACREFLSGGGTARDIHERTIQALRAAARERGVPDLESFDAQTVGHNIGLDLHDPPLLSRRDDQVKAGMVMNYELMDAQWGLGGVQIEDTALVTSNGIECFTLAPESLPVIG